PFWVFWPVAYLCLIYAGYRLWAKERHARVSVEEKLTANSPQAQKETTVRDQIANMTRSELLALKQLVRCGQQTEEQLVDFCRQNGLEVVTPGMLLMKPDSTSPRPRPETKKSIAGERVAGCSAKGATGRRGHGWLNISAIESRQRRTWFVSPAKKTSLRHEE